MNGFDNIAGYSLTVGTADVFISDSVAQYDPIIGNLANGAQRQYKFQFVDPSFNAQYETGVGTWNSGSSTFARTTVKTSSNGGLKEDFGAGPKVLFIVNDNEAIQSMGTKVETPTAKIMTAAERASIASSAATVSSLGGAAFLNIGVVAGTAAAGNDPRFNAEDAEDLDFADPLTGSEVAVVIQDGLPVQTNAHEIAKLAAPIDVSRSTNRRTIRRYSDLWDTPETLVVTTSGAAFGNEMFCLLSGAGAAVTQSTTSLLYQGVASASTGSTSAGIAAVVSNVAPIFFGVGGQDIRVGIVASASSIPGGAQDHVTQYGLFTDPLAGVASSGVFIRMIEGAANYQAVCRNSGVEAPVDTGVPKSSVAVSGAAALKAFVVDYTLADNTARFYIDGDLVATIATNIPTLAFLYAGVSIHKTFGASPAAINLDSFLLTFNSPAAAVRDQWL